MRGFAQPLTTPKADMLVQLDSSFYVECKAKLRYEQAVVNFIGRARREALDTMSDHLRQINAGFLVKIDVLKADFIPKLPSFVKEMVTNGVRQRSCNGVIIDITPFSPAKHTLPKPMSIHSEEMWKHLLGFEGWDEWHYALPFGSFMMSNLSNLIAEAVERPCLICIRAQYLQDSTQDIRETIKNACRRQLKLCSPGIVHILVNTALYGIGSRIKIHNIAIDLKTIGEKILQDYSRLSGIIFDILIPPSCGQMLTQVNQIVLMNQREDASNIHLPILDRIMLL